MNITELNLVRSAAPGHFKSVLCWSGAIYSTQPDAASGAGRLQNLK